MSTYTEGDAIPLSDPYFDYGNTGFAEPVSARPPDEHTAQTSPRGTILLEAFFRILVLLCSGVPSIKALHTFVPYHMVQNLAGPSANAAVIRRTNPVAMVLSAMLGMETNSMIIKQPFRHNVNEKLLQQDLSSFITELRVYTHECLVGHPNIAQLTGIILDEDISIDFTLFVSLYIETSPLGSLAEFQIWQHCYFSTKKAILNGVGIGLRALKHCGIIHGDIKPQNILIFPNKRATKNGSPFTAKLVDFGLSHINPDETVTARGFTEMWQAPEHRRGLPKGASAIHAADLFSFGMVCLKFLTMCESSETDKLVSASWYANVVDLIKVSQNSSYLQNIMDNLDNDPNLSSEESRLILSLCCILLPYKPEQRRLNPALDSLSALKYTENQATTAYESCAENWVTKLPLEIPSSVFADDRMDAFIHEGLSKFIVLDTPLALRYRGWAYFQLAQNRLQMNSIGALDISSVYQAAINGYFPAQAVWHRVSESKTTSWPARKSMADRDWLAMGTLTDSPTARNDLKEVDPELYREVYSARERFMILYARSPQEFKRAWFAFCVEVYDNMSDLDFTASQNLNLESTNGNKRGPDGQFRRILTVRMVQDWLKAFEESLPIVNVKSELEDYNHAVNELGDTELLSAFRAGNAALGLNLLKLGADPTISNRVGETPLHWLWTFLDEDVERVVHRVSSFTIDLDCTATQSSVEMLAGFSHIDKLLKVERTAQTALDRAVIHQNIRAVEMLLRLRGYQELTCEQALIGSLAIAIELNHPEICQAIFKSIKDPQILDVQVHEAPRWRRYLWRLEKWMTKVEPVKAQKEYYDTMSGGKRPKPDSPLRKLLCRDGIKRTLSQRSPWSLPDSDRAAIVKMFADTVRYVSADGETILHYLLEKGSPALVEAWLKTSSNRSALIHAPQNHNLGALPIHTAIANEWGVDLLLDHGAMLQDENCNPTISFIAVASMMSSESEAIKLLEKIQSQDFEYPYHNLSVVGFLIYGVQQYTDSFLCALRLCHFKYASRLLEISGGQALKTDIPSRIRFFGWTFHPTITTPLAYISRPSAYIRRTRKEHFAMLRYLLEPQNDYGKADFLARPILNMTALHLYISAEAVSSFAMDHDWTRIPNEALVADSDIARYLVKCGAEAGHLDTVDFLGLTALGYAVLARRLDIVTHLLEAGANPNITYSRMRGLFYKCTALDLVGMSFSKYIPGYAGLSDRQSLLQQQIIKKIRASGGRNCFELQGFDWTGWLFRFSIYSLVPYILMLQFAFIIVIQVYVIREDYAPFSAMEYPLIIMQGIYELCKAIKDKLVSWSQKEKDKNKGIRKEKSNEKSKEKGDEKQKEKVS